MRPTGRCIKLTPAFVSRSRLSVVRMSSSGASLYIHLSQLCVNTHHIIYCVSIFQRNNYDSKQNKRKLFSISVFQISFVSLYIPYYWLCISVFRKYNYFNKQYKWILFLFQISFASLYTLVFIVYQYFSDINNFGR